ncbi:MAG: sigma 54-interacting transcriptional regulator [Syntrophomonadaceae bacterium]|nr:sigma 54-interacting transcriptional regulator [Syntrophomonadaceae bacterium]
MKLSQIMSYNPIVLGPEQTIQEAGGIFLDHQIDGAPVVNEKGELLGLVTKTHIYRVMAGGKKPSTRVGEVMKKGLIIGHPDERVQDLIKTNVGRMPVLDQNAVVGMVTRTDLARVYFESFHSVSNEMQTILNSAHNLIISIDKNGNINVLNRAAERFLGLKSSTVQGRNIMKIIPNSGLMEILETGCSRPVQKIVLNNCTFISNRTPIKQQGEIIGAVAVLQDISELESISRELENVKELNKELDAIIESSYDGLYLTNGQGITLRVNEAFEKLTGVGSSEMVGRNVEDLVKERGIVSESVSALVLKAKKPITIMQKTLTGRLALTTGTPVFDRKGRIFRVVSNVREITELILLKQQLEQAQGLSKHYESELRALQIRYSGSEKLVISSRKMKDLLDTVIRLAQVDSTVLITGESGTGKELIAETIHNNSLRKNGPFIKINCGAISHNLLETELFGYEAGAFTGAKKGGKAGYFELAQGGTLLLDEISELPFNLQVNLLRVLQSKELIRVGGEKTVPVDVRIIAAANRDIQGLVEKNLFRKDLYYRLNVVPVEVPPLRERKEEIPVLAAHFVQMFNKKYKMDKELSANVIDVLMDYDWPGNVRELENIIERLVVTIPGSILARNDLPLHLKKNTLEKHPKITVTGILPLREAVETVEKQILEQAFQRYKATREVAQHLEVDPSTILRKAAKYGLIPSSPGQ